MRKDGYEWIEQFDRNTLQRVNVIRKMILYYFKPFRFEKYKQGKIYRLLGVRQFGRYLPTGGINIRRWTKRSMPSYTLKGFTRNALKSFKYKSCFFETLHLPFFLFLLGRSLWWFFKNDNLHLAVELILVNAIFNIYPIMHQRYTRIRIDRLIKMKENAMVK